MPMYRHECRECSLVWEEEYSLAVFDHYKKHGLNFTCPECEGDDTYRHVTDAGAIIFKGPGWSPDGYSKDRGLETYKGQGIKIYDRKEDHDREVAGQAREAELRRLKRMDEAAKRTLGPDAGVKQDEADRKIKKAGEDRVNQIQTRDPGK